MRGDKWGDFSPQLRDTLSLVFARIFNFAPQLRDTLTRGFLILDWPYYAPGLADAGRQGRGERERGRSHIPKNVGMTWGGG